MRDGKKMKNKCKAFFCAVFCFVLKIGSHHSLESARYVWAYVPRVCFGSVLEQRP